MEDIKMSNVCLLVTSQQCGHCVHMRHQTGLLPAKDVKPVVYGKYPYDYSFVRNILTVNGKYSEQKWDFINVHFSPDPHIGEISCFNLLPDQSIEQAIFYPDPTDSNVCIRKFHVIDENGTTDKCKDKHPFKMAFSLIAKNLVPTAETLMRRYAPFRPTFLYYTEETRKKYQDITGLQDKFYARGINAETSDKPPYYLTPKPDRQDLDPLKMLEYYDENEKLLIPQQVCRIVGSYQTAHSSQSR